MAPAPRIGTDIAWATDSTSSVIERVLAAQPQVAAQLAAAYEQAWTAVDPVLLELVRLRVAMMLGCSAELAERTPAAVAAGLDEATIAELPAWPTSARFGARERACLAYVEQWLIDVASMTDEDAAAVCEVLGADGLAAFSAALLVIEQRQRLRLAWQQIFGEEQPV